MKTTIELDEVKLDRIMVLTGISTMKEAVDWSLNEALRIATINRVMEDPWTAEEARAAVDPNYDLIAVRRSMAPVSYVPKKREPVKKSQSPKSSK
jgi:Arc/MetJ family transcription regulator